MISLITEEDITNLWVKFQEVKDRTLRHTKQIMELQKQLREFERGKKK